ncbi:sulfite reductase subunit alpha [Thermoproteus tenax]|uniref:Sulfite reductase, dissimilatory-type, alpha subunit n=1 Tax=Thermoproteus tenax (strain ATCC 35583 / DSM 2078 / JCM 9277 / NBRC 100435 / Kra 1) TaxID=768679 RepID=G4RNF2_THETK|nr:sulfite reductase subunit alpha [Thermoproteus tenax]CCC81096.1 sulfite reductase, dissimilatory-type, alpha subunit [Thermoproteus tenax Kra 1]
MEASQKRAEVDELARSASKVLERLENGPWPSHVKELKKSKYPLEAYAAGLAARKTQWAAGSAKIRYVYTGFIARRTRDGKYAELHFRVWQPSGQIYTTDYLRRLLDFADTYGLGLIEILGQQGMMIISVDPSRADEAIDALRALGTDVGATGDTIRELATCVGPALCEFALYDTLAARDYFLTHPKIYEWMSNQLFPFKFKAKFSGCPMDCTRAVHRSDFGFVGVWEGAPEVDQELLRRKIEAGEVDPKELAARCPSGAITWDGKELKIDGAKCKKSMECIRRAFPAIKPGKNRKIAVLVGGHVKGRFGGKMGKPLAIVNSVEEAMGWVVKTVESWMDGLETGVSKHKDRIGDFIMKVNFKKYTEEILGVKVPYKPSLHGRLGAGAVLDDNERKMWLEWVQNIVKEYEERI